MIRQPRVKNPGLFYIDLKTIMDWKTLKNGIYSWDGSWLDLYIQGITSTDWEKWVRLVNQQYRIEWHNGKTQKDESRIDFTVIEAYWKGNTNLCSTAKVFLDDRIQVNAHFFEATTIENDIDPRDFKSLEDHQKLLDYMKAVSTGLNKPITLTPENCPEIPLIRVEGTAAEISTGINPDDWPVRIKK